MHKMKDLFSNFHDICSFVANQASNGLSFEYQCEDFKDRFGSPKSVDEWCHPDDIQFLDQDLEAFIYIRLLENDNGYMPYFLKTLYTDGTLSGICFPQGDNLLGFENLTL